MTQYEKVVVSAYTGLLLVENFADLQCYIEAKLKHPVLTHELASSEMLEEIREKVKPDLLELVHKH